MLFRSKRDKIKKSLGCDCKKRINICTPKFCACGCLDEKSEAEDVVVLENVDLIYHDKENEPVHHDKMCICDEYIIAFAPAGEQSRN